VLQAASVIGTDVPFDALEAIAGVPRDELRRHLDQLQAAEFLYETALFPVLEYTFKHALTHEVAYGSLLGARCTRGSSRPSSGLRRSAERADRAAGRPRRPGRTPRQGRHLSPRGRGQGVPALGHRRGRRLLYAGPRAPRAPPGQERDRQELHLLLSLGPALQEMSSEHGFPQWLGLRADLRGLDPRRAGRAGRTARQDSAQQAIVRIR
jgi:hypothetical protein